MQKKLVCLYFQVHQPYRLRTYRFFDMGRNHDYFDDYANRFIMQQVAEKAYLPANALLMNLIKRLKGEFKVSFSISGTALDQFEQYAPRVMESFRELAGTDCVEFLAETDCHSLSAIRSKKAFIEQVRAHAERIKDLFGVEPTAFRNTELIYSNDIGDAVAEMGYPCMLTEGAKHVLGWKSPNFLYCNASNSKLKLLLRNFNLSDDIAFRFSEKQWSEWPLTAEKYVGWMTGLPANEEIINVFIDYETFGEHQWAESGIFDFLKAFPSLVVRHPHLQFTTPSEAARVLQPVSPLNVPYPISWADEERDLTAWLGNEMQDEAIEKLYRLEGMIRQTDEPEIARQWRYLQSSDHFYYMCTKWFSDGVVHRYFNPYASPYEAFINYMNVLSDFAARVEGIALKQAESKAAASQSSGDTKARGKARKARKARKASGS